jgi:hypothetical protein
VPETRVEGASALPKAGVKAQPQRPIYRLYIFFRIFPSKNRMSSPKTT